jgi:hypothetical protein
VAVAVASMAQANATATHRHWLAAIAVGSTTDGQGPQKGGASLWQPSGTAVGMGERVMRVVRSARDGL